MKQHLVGSIAALIAAPTFRFAADKGGATATATATATAEPEVEAEPYDPFADHPVVEVVEIEIKKLVLDAGTQARVSIDDEVVKEYTEIIKLALKNEEPIPFPAIDAFRDSTGRVVVADGFQRVLAHKAAHVKEISVNIHEGSETDALVYSLSANATHGLPRSNKDKNRAVKVAIEKFPDLSNVEIGKLCLVSEGTVRNIRAELKSKPTTKSVKIRGKRTKMDTSAIGKGKGGGKKGAKAAKKAAGANGSDEKALQEADKQLNKIVNHLGDAEGGKIRKAFHDGSLKLSNRDLVDWAGYSPKTAKAIAPLVTGGARMTPHKAYEFVSEELPEKVQTLLHNKALGSPDGIYEFKGEGFKVTVEAKK